LIIAHHAGLPESVRLAELAACWRLAPASLPAAEAQAIEQWQHAIARTASSDGDSPGLQQWLRRHVGRQSDEVFAEDEAQAALWALAQRERLARGEVVELPAGVRQEAVRFFLDPEPARHRIACALRQRGQELRLEPLDSEGSGTAGSRQPLRRPDARRRRRFRARHPFDGDGSVRTQPTSPLLRCHRPSPG
jgi:hypothetical protein